MTDRDRLIELFSPFADGTYNGSGTIIDGTKVDDIADHLLANDVFLLPEDLRGTEDFSISAFIEAMQMYKEKDRYIKTPCKVGDKVYVISRYYTGDWEVYKCEIDTITIYKNNTFISCVANDVRFGKINFGLNISDLNNTFFFTKEEAEQKLKKLVTDTNVGSKKGREG